MHSICTTTRILTDSCVHKFLHNSFPPCLLVNPTCRIRSPQRNDYGFLNQNMFAIFRPICWPKQFAVFISQQKFLSNIASTTYPQSPPHHVVLANAESILLKPQSEFLMNFAPTSIVQSAPAMFCYKSEGHF